MGVTTNAYSLEPKIIKKIRADNENLAFILGDCEDESQHWKVESYDFDKGIETYITMMREAGFVKTAKNIDSEYADLDLFDYNDNDLWIIPPSQVKAMCKELENVTFESLRAKNLSDITDRRGNPLNNDQLESYLSDIDGIKAFFRKAMEKGHYLLFAEG
ncbi:MAG: hypothetical protein RLZZ156_228 [Deinococcota bacterium]|jgi:hypothetical protein